VTPDKEGLALIKKLGISDRLRDPKEGDERENRFLSFRHNEFKADGTKADPIRIVEARGAENVPWDGRLIGNGSDVEVKFVVKDYGVGRKKGVYIRAVRVLNLVPYVAQDFAPLSSDDEFFSANAEATTPSAGSEPFPLPEGLEPVSGEPVEPVVEDELDDDVPM
jgi:hypothetical protein